VAPDAAGPVAVGTNGEATGCRFDAVVYWARDPAANRLRCPAMCHLTWDLVDLVSHERLHTPTVMGPEDTQALRPSLIFW